LDSSRSENSSAAEQPAPAAGQVWVVHIGVELRAYRLRPNPEEGMDRSKCSGWKAFSKPTFRETWSKRGLNVGLKMNPQLKTNSGRSSRVESTADATKKGGRRRRLKSGRSSRA
jgi:hypothetical protein